MIINNIVTGYIDDIDKKDTESIVNKEYIFYHELRYYQTHSEYCNTYDVFLVKLSTYYSLSNILNDFNKFIPLDILYKIRNKEIILGIYNAFEAMYGYEIIDTIYEEFVNNYEIPESQLLLVGGAYDYLEYTLDVAKRLNKQPIKLEYFLHIQLFLKNNINGYNITSGLKKNNTKKKFLFLNKYARPHRVGLVCLLNNKGLLEHSYTSLLECNTDSWDDYVDLSKQQFSDIKDFYKNDDLKHKVPLQLDVELRRIKMYEQAEYNFSIFLLKYYYQTYFSVVTETLYDSHYPRFFTEKTLKPIIAKHPFILASCPNSLASLRFLGFKTFHPLINEEYDLETNDSKRLLMIADEVERLCNLSDADLELFKEQALEIVEYNYNHYMTTHIPVVKLL